MPAFAKGVPRPHRRRPIPADFAERAGRCSISSMANHYHSGTATVERWCRELGITPTSRRCDARPMPEDFPKMAPTMGITALVDRYETSRPAVQRWCKEAGVSPKPFDNKAPKPGHARKDSYHRMPLAKKRRLARMVARDVSLEGQAADVLRRLAAVYRCSDRGQADPKGEYWRFGNAVLTGEEMLERAKRHGFDPHAWRALPAFEHSRLRSADPAFDETVREIERELGR